VGQGQRGHHHTADGTAGTTGHTILDSTAAAGAWALRRLPTVR
jgi:hypothetical protein